VTQVRLHFDISSYWHVGSGRGRDAVLDAEVVRDPAGLPFIPGKTVKGLIRHAVELAAAARGDERKGRDSIIRLFGSEVPEVRGAEDGDAQVRAVERGRYDTEAGCLWFGSATLPEAWSQWARARPSDRDEPAREDIRDALFRVVASTAIDPDGVALGHTLRVSEVVVPMTLTATLLGPDPAGGPDWMTLVEGALPYLRSLGVRRRRGYGRVTVTMERP